MPADEGKLPVKAVDEQEVRNRAYEIYLERGAHPGRDMEDWLQAERELGLSSE